MSLRGRSVTFELYKSKMDNLLYNYLNNRNFFSNKFKEKYIQFEKDKEANFFNNDIKEKKNEENPTGGKSGEQIHLLKENYFAIMKGMTRGDEFSHPLKNLKTSGSLSKMFGIDKLLNKLNIGKKK